MNLMNLSDEQRAASATRANKANADSSQHVGDMDDEEKLNMSKKSLEQIDKIIEVLEALGWSCIFVGINKETNATFKQIKGTPAMLANAQYTKAQMGLEDQFRVSHMVTKSFPSIAKSLGKNKSVQQSHMEHLALVLLNACVAEAGLNLFSTFLWTQVQSKQLFNQTFHFKNWPLKILLKRRMTIEECDVVIRMFERREIQGSIGVEQAEGTEVAGDHP
ncbi:hypothetical protein HDU78_010616 [Chytriomyces hyalinus]|nr:hypothetical protein HDU78_010616 [Chytriomyces hyalinus]